MYKKILLLILLLIPIVYGSAVSMTGCNVELDVQDVGDGYLLGTIVSAEDCNDIAYRITYELNFSGSLGEVDLLELMEVGACPLGPNGEVSCWEGWQVADYSEVPITIESFEQKCAGEGVSVGSGFPDFCCEGLSGVTLGEKNAFGKCDGLIGGYLCTDCGNGVCEEWEDDCSCAVDCESGFFRGIIEWFKGLF